MDTSGRLVVGLQEHQRHRIKQPVLPINVDGEKALHAPHQHMVIYSVSFGVIGTLDPDSSPGFRSRNLPKGD